MNKSENNSAGGSDEHPGSELLVSELEENEKVGKKCKAEVLLLVLLRVGQFCNLLLTSALPCVRYDKNMSAAVSGRLILTLDLPEKNTRY